MYNYGESVERLQIDCKSPPAHQTEYLVSTLIPEKSDVFFVHNYDLIYAAPVYLIMKYTSCKFFNFCCHVYTYDSIYPGHNFQHMMY